MVSLKSHQWKAKYTTTGEDLFEGFYIKAFGASVKYDRAVGFFSSGILSSAIQGISEFQKNNGKMRLLIGHPLSDEEYSVVKNNLDANAVNKFMLDSFVNLFDTVKGIQEYRLKIMAWMIASGVLEIRYALRRRGMYHEKIGIFTDKFDNKIVFTGSANETPNGILDDHNAESVIVFKSWDKSVFENYGLEIENSFTQVWSGKQKGTITLDMPSDTYETISKYAIEASDISLQHEKNIYIDNLFEQRNQDKNLPFIPEAIDGNKFTIFDHQRSALNSWKDSDFTGIMKLATGSGKTITSIYGAVKLFEAKKKLFVIVAVPYVELANQWIENLELFNIHAIKCYDGQNSWRDELSKSVIMFATHKLTFCCVVVVNKTLQGKLFTDTIKNLNPKDLMLIGDECHRHGANKVHAALPNAFYRLGLSATPFNDDDDEFDSPFPQTAKNNILDYYKQIVYEYDLLNAITDNVLTPYNYHIYPIRLSEDEFNEYQDLSKKIGQLLASGKVSSKDSQQKLTLLCGQRSRLIGSAENKYLMLKELLNTFPREKRKHTLVYCGEGLSSISRVDNPNEQYRNIEVALSTLQDCNWTAARFTSSENQAQRFQIMLAFKEGIIDALVSMKVLDEGVDVPSCKTAIILASTKNPRQYVQRRGRILRKAAGKSIATIYDFVTLPPLGYENTSAAKSLLNSEYQRVRDFALIARNQLEIQNNIDKLGFFND